MMKAFDLFLEPFGQLLPAYVSFADLGFAQNLLLTNLCTCQEGVATRIYHTLDIPPKSYYLMYI